MLTFIYGCVGSRSDDKPMATIDLSAVDTEINGIDLGYIDIGTSHNNNYYNKDAYSLIRNGEWAVRFDYGVIAGTSRCSAYSGAYNVVKGYNTDSSLWTSDEDTLLNFDKEPTKCWCVITDTTSVDGEPEYLSESLWVYNGTHHNSSDCEFFCAYSCAENIKKDLNLRTAIFSVSE